MNATAAPISSATATPVGASPAKTPPQANHFGTDAVYKGYDLMVRKFATHIIREPMVTSSTRADLVRAISSPAVTFAASAADGSILISCPTGLPEILAAIAEPLDHGPSPTAATDKLAQMLDQIERKMDSVIQEQQGFERLSDRLEAIEYTLRDRLDPEADQTRARVLEAELGQIGHRLDMVLDRIAQIPEPIPLDTMPLELMQAASETRLLTALQTPPDYTPVIDAVQQVAAQIAAIPAADQTLARVEAKLDELATRPVPTPDLSALTDAEASLTALAQRLDLAVGSLPNPETLAAQDKALSALATQLDATPVEVERLLAPRLTFAAIEADLGDLKQSLHLTAQASTTGQALAHLSAQVTALSDRPQPVLDLSGVTQAVDALDRRVNDLTQITSAGPDLAPLTAQFQTVLSTLGQPAQSGALERALTHLATLSTRPDPVLDLGEPLAGLAQIRQTLGDMTQTLTDLTRQTAAGPDLTPLEAQYDRLLTRLDATAQGAAVLPQLEGMAQTLATLATLASRPQPDLDLSEPLAALTQIQSNLQLMTTSLTDLQHLAAAKPDLTAVEEQLDTLLATIGQPAQHAAITASLSELHRIAAAKSDLVAMGDQLDSVLAAIGQTARQAAIATGLNDLTDLVSDLATRPGPDLTATTQTLTQIAQMQANLQRQLQEIGATLPQGAATQDQFETLLATLGQPAQSGAVTQLADQVTHLADTLAREPDHTILTAGFDMVLSAITRAAQPGTHPALDHLEQIAQHLDSIAAGADTDTLIARIEAQFAQLGQPAQDAAVAAALADLTEQIAAVAERPDPVIDMTAQRQGFARFGTALANAVERLETVAQSLAAGPDLTPVLALVLAPVLAQIDALRADLSSPDTAWAQALGSLADQMADLSNRPDPVPLIADQAQALTDTLAQMTQGIEALIQGFADSPDTAAMLMQLEHTLTTAVQTHGAETLAEPLATLSGHLADLASRPVPSLDLEPLKADLADILSPAVDRLDRVMIELAADDQGQILSRIDALRADLAEQYQGQGLITDMAARLATLAERPDLSTEIAEQKQNLADFAKGLADLVQWLEPLTRDLANGPDYGVILAEFDRLRADLAQTDRDQTLQRGLADLSDQISDLAKSPDGLISLAEQRRSFASFSNALAFMLQRLDSLGAAPVAQSTPDDATGDDGDAVQRLTHQVNRLSAGHTSGADQALGDIATTLSSLILRLEFLVDGRSPVAALEAPAAKEPADLIQDLATATQALAQIVMVLEADTGVADLPPAATVSVAQLFDRLDAALHQRAHKGGGQPAARSNPVLTEAIATLSNALHGGMGPRLPAPGQEAAFLGQLRLDFAEFVARALQVQTETP